MELYLLFNPPLFWTEWEKEKEMMANGETLIDTMTGMNYTEKNMIGEGEEVRVAVKAEDWVEVGVAAEVEVKTRIQTRSGIQTEMLVSL